MYIITMMFDNPRMRGGCTLVTVLFIAIWCTNLFYDGMPDSKGEKRSEQIFWTSSGGKVSLLPIFSFDFL